MLPTKQQNTRKLRMSRITTAATSLVYRVHDEKKSNRQASQGKGYEFLASVGQSIVNKGTHVEQ